MIRSKYRTGDKTEALLVSDDVLDLAKRVLSSEEIDHANEITLMIVGSEFLRKKGIATLMKILGTKPYRPLIYANNELQYLPHWTRDSVRYVCDYIDQLCKHWAYIYTQRITSLNGSMGSSLKTIRKKESGNNDVLIDILEKFNNVFYVPAKHDFSLPEGRKNHRITVKEVVYTVFISVELAKRIKMITNCSEQMECHNGEMAKHSV